MALCISEIEREHSWRNAHGRSFAARRLGNPSRDSRSPLRRVTSVTLWLRKRDGDVTLPVQTRGEPHAFYDVFVCDVCLFLFETSVRKANFPLGHSTFTLPLHYSTQFYCTSNSTLLYLCSTVIHSHTTQLLSLLYSASTLLSSTSMLLYSTPLHSPLPLHYSTLLVSTLPYTTLIYCTLLRIVFLWSQRQFSTLWTVLFYSVSEETHCPADTLRYQEQGLDQTETGGGRKSEREKER